MTGYDFHPEARFDLDEIWEYIRADNLNAADRTISEILSAIRALIPFPGQGHRRPDLTSRPLRFIVVREYLVAYAPDEKPFPLNPIRDERNSPLAPVTLMFCTRNGDFHSLTQSHRGYGKSLGRREDRRTLL